MYLDMYTERIKAKFLNILQHTCIVYTVNRREFGSCTKQARMAKGFVKWWTPTCTVYFWTVIVNFHTVFMNTVYFQYFFRWVTSKITLECAHIIKHIIDITRIDHMKSNTIRDFSVEVYPAGSRNCHYYSSCDALYGSYNFWDVQL